MKEKVIPHLRNSPEALKLIENRIINPNFFRRVGNDLLKVYKESSQSDFFAKNLKALNK